MLYLALGTDDGFLYKTQNYDARRRTATECIDTVQWQNDDVFDDYVFTASQPLQIEMGWNYERRLSPLSLTSSD